MSQTTTLIAPLRNEGPFVLEWIAYHKVIGFDVILIYADDSRDESSALLDALEVAGEIILIPNGPETSPAKGHRHRAYTRALSHPAVQSADWAMALDADEFLTIHAGAGLLPDLLDPLSEADVISPAWRVFGNSGIIAFEDAPLIPRFTRAAPAEAILTNRHLGLKSLFRPSSISKIGPHRPVLDTGHDPLWLNGSGQDVTQAYRESGWAATPRTLGYGMAQINHYMIRANEVFALHNLNTPPLGDEASPLSVEDYTAFNTNHAEDTSMARHADAVTSEVARLMALPAVADAHHACVAMYGRLIRQMHAIAETTPDSPIPPLMDADKAKAVIREQVKWLATHAARTKASTPDQAPPEDEGDAGQILIDPDHLAPRWLQDLRHSDHRRGWYWSDDKFAAQFTQRSRDTLVVSFDNLSSVNDPSLARETWGYSFYRAEGWSHLGVMAFEKNWYRDDALFDFMETTGKATFRRFKKVVLTGTSMGAYAATAFAKLVPGCTVVAFSPQSTLDKKLVPWEERFGSGRKQDWSGRYRDAPDDCDAAKDVFVIYDPYFEPDRLHAERYHSANVTFLKSWYSSHKSAQFMRRAEILKTVMQQAVAGTLDAASYYQLIRSRRDLIWYYNGLADHLIGAGHLKLADQLARHLITIGRPGVARAIQARL